jgi:hypothetical protein
LEDYWFGGMLDGEGSMSKPDAKKSPDVNVSQRHGDVWDRMIKYVENKGYNYRIESDKNYDRESKYGDKPTPKICFGRMNDIFQLIGQTRPSRFIQNRFWEGRWLPGRKIGGGLVKVVKVEKLEGEQTLIDLQTSTGTYVAEGLVSHNTTEETLSSLDDVLFNPNMACLMLSYDIESQQDIFDKKILRAWRNLPEELKQLYEVHSERSNQLTIGFGDDGTGNQEFSSIQVRTKGRSGTFQRVHVSELGKISRQEPRKSKEIISGTLQTVPTDGRVDIESTAEGEFGDFYDMFWEAWERGEPETPVDYKAHFYNWQWDTEEINQIKYPEKNLPEKFKDYQKKMNLGDLEITYYYYKWLTLKKDDNLLMQEYPTTPHEAFVSSGAKLFSADAIEAMPQEEPTRYGGWAFYERYQPGHRYALGADVAEGAGQDYSAAVIIDFDWRDPNTFTKIPKVVAIYADNMVQPDTFGWEIINGANMYGNCIIAVERNGPGLSTLNVLKENYFHIYKERKSEYAPDKETEKLGWHTNKSTKPKMMYELSTAMNEGNLLVTDLNLQREARTYDKEDLTRMNFDADLPTHWDRLIACAIAYQMASHVVPSYPPDMEPEDGPQVDRFHDPLEPHEIL